MSHHENLVETTIELENGQIGIPTVVVGRVKCELSLFSLNYTRNIDMAKPPYSEWRLVEKLEPCERDELSENLYFDVLPDPFGTSHVVIPLYDARGAITKVKFIQVLSLDND